MSLRSELLSALAAFESAARHLNFAHAAAELHLTASAVSHHVRKLEARLGVPLFRRHARGVVLTAAGRELANAASASLGDLDDVLRGLRARRDERDLVRVATLHSWTVAWLLPRLPDFRARHPGIQLSIETGFAPARFDDNGPDLGIRHGAGHWHGLAAEQLMPETLLPVAAPALEGIANAHAARDIPSLPLVSDSAQQGWPDWFRFAGVRGVADVRYRFTDSTAALNAAAMGLGAALARDRIVAPWLREGRLLRLPGPAMRARWSYYLIHPAHRTLRAPAQAFVDWLRAQARADPGIDDDAPASARPRKRINPR